VPLQLPLAIRGDAQTPEDHCIAEFERLFEARDPAAWKPETTS